MNNAYISATGLNALTISGPPRTLNDLFKSEPFKALRPLQLPISGPYHATHIYNETYIKDHSQFLAATCVVPTTAGPDLVVWKK